MSLFLPSFHSTPGRRERTLPRAVIMNFNTKERLDPRNNSPPLKCYGTIGQHKQELSLPLKSFEKKSLQVQCCFGRSYRSRRHTHKQKTRRVFIAKRTKLVDLTATFVFFITLIYQATAGTLTTLKGIANQNEKQHLRLFLCCQREGSLTVPRPIYSSRVNNYLFEL